MGNQERSTAHGRWLIPLGGLLALAGYFGPWIDHKAAALVVTGLDLGEYVKFLPSIRGGQVTVWRQGFYLPLVAVSLIFSLHLFRRDFRYGLWMHILMVTVAIVAALNMLPPAWTPARLVTPEFKLQTIAIGVCLAAVAFSPFLALLPRALTRIFALVLCGAALWFPLRDFLRVRPDIDTLYNHTMQPGWGMWVLVLGLLTLAAGSGLGEVRRRRQHESGRSEQPAHEAVK